LARKERLSPLEGAASQHDRKMINVSIMLRLGQ
jgi:hypothetical protein